MTQARRPLLSAGLLLLCAAGAGRLLDSAAFAAPSPRAPAGQAWGYLAHRPAQREHRAGASSVAASGAAVLVGHGTRLALLIAAVAASRLFLITKTDFVSSGAKRLILCVAVGLLLNLNPYTPQTVAFSIAAATTLGFLVEPVSAATGGLIGLAAATLAGTLQVGNALSGFGAPLLWLALLIPICAKGFGEMRTSVHMISGNILDKVPFVGKSWANSIADVLTAPLQCDRGDGLANSMYLTGSNANILAACLAIGCLGVQGLGIQEWTRLALPMVLVLALRPFLQRTWKALGLGDEDAPKGAVEPKFVFNLDDFLRSCLFVWAVVCAGIFRAVQPVAAMLGVFSVMSLRGRLSFKDFGLESFENLAIFASLVVLSGGIGSVYVRMGGFLTDFLWSVPLFTTGLRPWVLIAAYLGLRRYFRSDVLHVATLFPTFLAALCGSGFAPAPAAVTLVLATNLGTTGQTSKQAFKRFAEIAIFVLARRRPLLVAAVPLIGAFAVSLFEKRDSLAKAISSTKTDDKKKDDKKKAKVVDAEEVSKDKDKDKAKDNDKTKDKDKDKAKDKAKDKDKDKDKAKDKDKDKENEKDKDKGKDKDKAKEKGKDEDGMKDFLQEGV